MVCDVGKVPGEEAGNVTRSQKEEAEKGEVLTHTIWGLTEAAEP